MIKLTNNEWHKIIQYLIVIDLDKEELPSLSKKAFNKLKRLIGDINKNIEWKGEQL